MNEQLIEYRKTATVKAKIFELGDEDGFIEVPEHYVDRTPIPYVRTLENPTHQGWFGKNYLCYGIKGEKWLVEKEIFESTYEAIQSLQPKEQLSAEEVLNLANKANEICDFAIWCMKYMYTKYKDGFYRSPINVIAKFTIQELYQHYEDYKHLDK